MRGVPEAIQLRQIAHFAKGDPAMVTASLSGSA